MAVRGRMFVSGSLTWRVESEMRVLHTLKLPLMLVVCVGSVWAAAWQSSVSDSSKCEMLPATAEAKQLTVSIRRAAAERGELIADTETGDVFH